jgi:hypothetical protein
MREPVTLGVPAKTGIERSTGKMFPTWRRFRGALARVLCLADPWVPAFTGTAFEL